MGGVFLYFGTLVSDGMPIYPCALIFVTGKLNLFSKKVYNFDNNHSFSAILVVSRISI